MLTNLRQVLTFYDKLLIISIILITLVGIGISIFYFNNDGAEYIVIEYNDEIVHKIRLVSGLEKKVTLPLSSGKAEVVIDEGKVRMLEMPNEICPLGICSDTGWISNVGDMIVCMPNKIIITIEKTGVSSQPDAITY
ncbi:NusG domain II-containing protein [Selenihalanaerobacter shriftii]|uniref:Uncharacterized protein n=1 Tax=Selenihalanaerobacter shriftii TaxID=142842 RepID=A0A1T4MRE8_9FIRM|nr:NusG domain II-containing protein [Selenihalanaerobacter shriftii]SJZ69582.1 hypothetical protein SAMN02745118_01581 [Selenihalanaerobacter shriftii]